MALVVINDYVVNQRYDLVFMNEDFDAVKSVWEDEDSLLHQLQHVPYFKDRFRWCDLDPSHFRFMIARNLSKAAQLPKSDKLDLDDPIIRSMNFLICCLIRSLELRSDSFIEVMKIIRIDERDITIEYQSIMLPDTDPGGRGKLSVIVDNT